MNLLRCLNIQLEQVRSYLQGGKRNLCSHPSLLPLWCVPLSECCFRMESLHSCSGPWLPLRNGIGTDPQPCPEGHCAVLSVGRHKASPGESWAGFSHLMSSGCRNGALFLNFFLEHARGFQGIDNILYLYFGGERNLYSSGSATPCKTL